MYSRTPLKLHLSVDDSGYGLLEGYKGGANFGVNLGIVAAKKKVWVTSMRVRLYCRHQHET